MLIYVSPNGKHVSILQVLFPVYSKQIPICRSHRDQTECIFKIYLLSNAPSPNLLIITYASLIEQYDSEYREESM